jgi:hypothetical protein
LWRRDSDLAGPLARSKSRPHEALEEIAVPRPDDLGLLTEEEWNTLQDACDQLEAALDERKPVDLKTLLPEGEPPKRLIYLLELIKTELEIRYRQKRGLPLEVYVQRYPEIGSLSGLPASLIYEEYRVRMRYGDQPPLALYQRRFPDRYEEMLALVGRAVQPALPHLGPEGIQTSRAALPLPERRSTSDIDLSETGYVLPVGGGYRLLQRLGTGAFGEVYKAVAPDGRKVAVKIMRRELDDEACQREMKALETLFRLEHPHLLRTHGHWANEGRMILVMELADGSLSERLEQYRQRGQEGVPAEELLPYFTQAAEALDFLHSQKVMHRDIKPQNLLYLKREAKVADFGLAREQDGTIDVTSRICGTPIYMPPETWQNKISVHSDQYSLAVAYVELRLGRPPYQAKNMYQLRQHHLHGQPDLAQLLGPERDVLLKALARDPQERYANCRAFVAALTRALPSNLPGEPMPTTKRSQFRLAFLTTAIVLLALVLCWLCWWFW